MRTKSEPRSWGHYLAPRTDDRNWMGRDGQTCTNGKRCPRRTFHSTCATGEYGNPDSVARWYVGGPATWQGGYRYVTGRAGRVSHRELFFCDDCATRFATRHGLPSPSSVPKDTTEGTNHG